MRRNQEPGAPSLTELAWSFAGHTSTPRTGGGGRASATRSRSPRPRAHTPANAQQTTEERALAYFDQCDSQRRAARAATRSRSPRPRAHTSDGAQPTTEERALAFFAKFDDQRAARTESARKVHRQERRAVDRAYLHANRALKVRRSTTPPSTIDALN